MADQPEPIHPESAETLRQLLEIHGCRCLIEALATVSQAAGDAIARANPKDATAPFAHRANATVLRSIVKRLYS